MYSVDNTTKYILELQKTGCDNCDTVGTVTTKTRIEAPDLHQY